MKIKELELKEDKLMLDLQTQENNGETNIYIPAVGTETEPVINVFRPIGGYVTARVHFLKQLSDVAELPSSVKCIGNGCPFCHLVKELWATNLPEAIDKARKIKAIERVAMNVLPIGILKGNEIVPYEWGESGKRVLVFYFGVTIKRQLETLFRDYGHAGALNGYSIALSVYKGTMGNRYVVDALKSKKRTNEGIIETVNKSKLTEDELELEVNDLSEAFPSLSKAELAEITGKLNIDTTPKPVTKAREEITPKDKNESVESFLCFGDKELFNPISCANCKIIKQCKEEIEKAG